MKLQAPVRPGLAGLTGAWSFIQEVRRGTRLDKRLSVALNGCRMLTARKQEKLRRALALERKRMTARLAANWRQVQALADEIETATAAGQPHHRQLMELDQMGRRATQLAEAGAAIDLQLSELGSIDHSRPGMRWRPTAAEPF